MPGKRISDFQVLKFKTQRRSQTQAAAAAKAGISERTARRLESLSALPSQRQARQWRTREDPLAAVWSAELLPLLESKPALSAVTLLEELQRRHPGEYAPSTLRTLQRRVRQWRATEGGEREVYFAQEHPPGRQALSDFTNADDLGITVAGEAFPHLLYQFALAHSGWRKVEVVVDGESFTALATGLQSALWELGGSPEEHRTDSLHLPPVAGMRYHAGGSANTKVARRRYLALTSSGRRSARGKYAEGFLWAPKCFQIVTVTGQGNI
jgi:hypothetical protein